MMGDFGCTTIGNYLRNRMRSFLSFQFSDCRGIVGGLLHHLLLESVGQLCVCVYARKKRLKIDVAIRKSHASSLRTDFLAAASGTG